MQLKTKPKVTLVGAGPGDPELITLKAVKAIQKADVILYDALVNTDLLDYAPNAIKLFVGKRVGYQKYTQEEINELIVQHAFNYGHVVRLKGGDPFIFGRGSEEINYIDNFGISVSVVTGISSASAVPASIGVPLTHRGVSESFWVITGTTSKRKLSKDVHLAAQSTATVVILMGVSKLNEIVTVFERERGRFEPIALIQNGTTKHEKVAVGTINTIEEVARAKQIAAPAIIIIGEVVTQSAKLKRFYEEVLIELN